MDPGTATVIAGGLGLLGSKGAKSSADKAAGVQSDAMRQQQPLIDMIVRAGQEGWGAYQGANASGAFDADAERANLLRNFDMLQNRAAEGLAANARLGGYRPGDSVVSQQNLLTRNAITRDTANQLAGLKRNLLMQRLAALAATNPQLAGQAAGLIQGNANAMSQIKMNSTSATNPAALFMAMLPYLNRSSGGATPPFNPNAGNPTGFTPNLNYGAPPLPDWRQGDMFGYGNR